MIINEEQIRRMIDVSGISSSVSAGAGGGGGTIPAGSFVGIDYYNHNFGLCYKQVTTDGTTGEVSTSYLTAAPNEIPIEGTTTDPTTGDVTVTSMVGQMVKNALVIGELMIVYDETNNALKVVNRDGSTAANFYATGGVSALGYSPGGGGGGGADLNALLDSINTSSIGSTTPGASNVGKCLVWTANGWAWGTTGEGGGGTVTAITAGTGLSGGTITGSGTIAISSAYQGYISHGETAYGWGDHANAGYATQEWVNQQGYVKSSGVTSVGLSMPTGFTVSGSPVTSSGTLTVGIASGYFMPTTTQRTTWNNKQNAISDLATIRSGAAAGATAVQPSAISDMATKTWVEDQGYVTSSGVTSVGLSMPTGFSVSGSPVTTSGTLSVGIASGYFIPTTAQRTTWNGKQDAISDLETIRSNAANGNTAYNSLSSYLPLTGGTLTGALHMGSAAGASPYIYWGDGSYAYIGEDSDDHITLRGDKGVNILTGSNYGLQWNGDTVATRAWVEDCDYMRFYIIDNYVRAEFNPDGGRTAKAQDDGFIEWWASGGYFNHHVGNVEIGSGTTDTSHYIQIGGGRIYWDNQSKSLYVVQADGSTAANLYATGGVSALGISTGGTPSVSALTVGTLNATTGNVTRLNVNGKARFDDDIIINVGGTDMYLDLGRCVELGILS